MEGGGGKERDKHSQPNLFSFDPCYQDVTYDQDTYENIKVMKNLFVDAVDELTKKLHKPSG